MPRKLARSNAQSSRATSSSDNVAEASQQQYAAHRGLSPPSPLDDVLLQSPFFLLLFDVGSGCLVDANPRFCSFAGWTLDECRWKMAQGAPYHQVLAWGEDMQPTTRVADISPGRSRSSSSWPLVSQYPSTLRKLKELYQGRHTSTLSVWRTRMANGQVCEAEKLSWLIGRVQEFNALDGTITDRPKQIAFIFDHETWQQPH